MGSIFFERTNSCDFGLKIDVSADKFTNYSVVTQMHEFNKW